MIEISFPVQSAGDAGELAKELRSSLLQHGISDDDIQIVKGRADTMDLGSLVQIAEPVIALALNSALFIKIIREVCLPARAGIRIKTDDGIFELKAAEIDSEKLHEILTVRAVPRSRTPQRKK